MKGKSNKKSRKGFSGITKSEEMIEIKCFLQRPLDMNYEILRRDMCDLVKGEPEQTFYEQEPIIQKAVSLEDLLNGSVT